jgi:WD40 repeat protein
VFQATCCGLGLIFVGGGHFSAKIWDALTGSEKATLQHKHIVRTCCFSPCSGKLVTGAAQKAFVLSSCGWSVWMC